jgi:hypothetical protein
MPTHLIVEYDGLHEEWRCDLHDEAHCVVVTKTKQEMEEALDYLEATGRLEGKERHDAGSEQEAERTDSHR